MNLKLSKSNNQMPCVSDSQIPLGSEIASSSEDSHPKNQIRSQKGFPGHSFSLASSIKDLLPGGSHSRNASGLAVLPEEGSLSKTSSLLLPVNSRGSRRRISSNSPLGSLRSARSFLKNLDTVETPERSRSRTPLPDSPGGLPARSLSRSSEDSLKGTRHDKSISKQSATNGQIKRSGPRSRTQQKPTEISGKRPGLRSRTQEKPTEISGNRSGPLSRTHQDPNLLNSLDSILSQKVRKMIIKIWKFLQQAKTLLYQCLSSTNQNYTKSMKN
ncbi:uncharacterized protein LOC103317498 [Nasonia vitripennis]|uniref:Uncharacterized protein n=1 Tax=Nasonia vitripennis TaxID=7425 RepID=A0A7M7PZ91_NASVI|nr:uncharacterized protein LOC103317498 [Nasonia vitripennis]